MNTKTNQNDPEAQEAALLLAVRDFMRLESAGGILLLGAAILAILMANSPLAINLWRLAGYNSCYSGRNARDKQATRVVDQ